MLKNDAFSSFFRSTSPIWKFERKKHHRRTFRRFQVILNQQQCTCHAKLPLDWLDPVDPQETWKPGATALDERKRLPVKRQLNLLCELEGTFTSVRLLQHSISLPFLATSVSNDYCWEVYFLLKISNLIDWICADARI